MFNLFSKWFMESSSVDKKIGGGVLAPPPKNGLELVDEVDGVAIGEDAFIFLAEGGLPDVAHAQILGEFVAEAEADVEVVLSLGVGGAERGEVDAFDVGGDGIDGDGFDAEGAGGGLVEGQAAVGAVTWCQLSSTRGKKLSVTA
jgi:hypothetical protein